ncbi:MAG TPA: ATP-binding protein [Candidatus Limnocylindrales bacterium]|nr:ATP-binding protein [Candidatus Limnocylindrales bacterium]
MQAKEELEARSEELAHSLAMVRATLEATTDAILATNSARKVTGFNQNFVRLWNLPEDVLASSDHRAITRLVAANFADPASFLARVDEIYETQPEETFDVLTLSDGRVIERLSRIQFLDGCNVGRVWSFRDVTESRRVEEALREETRLLELLNRTGTAISSKLELPALMQAITDTATELSGARFGAFFYNLTDNGGDSYQLYALSGAPREAFEEFGHPRATPIFGPTFRGEAIVRSDDVQADPRYGRMAPHYGLPPGHLPVHSYLAVPVILRDGTVIGALLFGHPERGVFNERSERLISAVASQAAVAIDNARLYEDVKRASRERELLLEAERAARSEAERINLLKDEFLATLSHELRTPLTAILGWSHVLASGRYGPADLERAIEVIGRNARVQTRLIEDLLDMSRIISGKVRLDVQRFDPATVVGVAIDSVRPSAEAKNIRIRKMFDADVGLISGDSNRIQQIVWNLLSNAVKFTPAEGSIEVVLRRGETHIEIVVRDTGQGIEAEFLPMVFDRFRQADSSSTRRYGGLGLGLAIVKQLVELHGGSVRADSAGPGKGSTFTVTLPRASMVGEQDAARGQARVGPGQASYEKMPLHGLRILVVDDESDTRELIQRVFEHCDADVHVAAGAKAALESIPVLRPHVLVSDIGMPEMDGYQLIRAVRRLPAEQGGRTPAVAVTAFARSEDRTRALLAGYQVHIAKPIEPAELVATVASLTGRMSDGKSDGRA